MSMRAVEFQPRLNAMMERDLGKEVRALLADHETEDILRNSDGGLWTYGEGKFLHRGQMDDSQALDIMAGVAACNDSEINQSRPILETILLLDGSRFEAAVPPIVNGPIFAIRKRARRVHTLDEYKESGVLTCKDDPLNQTHRRDRFADLIRGFKHPEIIEKALALRKNVLVAGRVGSGKTTLVNAMVRKIGEICPNDRLVLIEDTTELQCSVKNHVAMLAVSEAFSMQVCLSVSMRLKPTRIIVGEVRNKEALALLMAWNTGHPGGVGTIHAEDSVGALIRLEMLVAMATAAPLQKLIAETIDLVVVIDEEARLPVGRKVREVGVVKGYENGRYVVDQV